MKNKIVKDTLALTVITLISGLLLGVVNDITAGPIASQQAKEKEEAYKAVFADAASFEVVISGEDADLESYLDENGYLYISGRKSDMIISGGENIFPLEVENVLRMNEEIAEVSVLGVPDEYWGESVQAAVVLRPDSKLTPEEIRTFCRGKIAGYKIPKKVYVWKELPKNTTGKVCKAEVLKKIEM